MKTTAEARKRRVELSDYRALAEFRHHIRRYLEFSDKAAKAVGLEPKQYQLLLAIKGLPEDIEPKVIALAQQLRLRHHSAVELIDRAEKNALVTRIRIGNHAVVRVTKKGDRILAKAVKQRLEELRVAGPLLVNALQQLISATQHKRNRK